ncbi:MAG: hypothetical protein ABW168_01990 [Sedimenticola sp.]
MESRGWHSVSLDTRLRGYDGHLMATSSPPKLDTRLRGYDGVL